MVFRRRAGWAAAVFIAPLCCGAQDLQGAPLDPPRPRDLSDFLGASITETRGDGRRTMGRFASNLGRNLVGVFSRENLHPLLAGTALAATGGALFDASARGFFEGGSRAEGFGKLGQTLGGSTIMGPASLAFFVAGRGSRDARFRAVTYDGLQATLVAGAYTGALKHAIGRERPDFSNRLSFPSGHASHAFAWAAVVDHHYGGRTGLAAYGAASLIGLSRLERNRHFVSDVLAGATLGYVAGRTVARRNDEAPRSERRFQMVPLSDPSGAGAGLGISLSF